MSVFKKKSVEHFNSGLSCTESIVKAAYDIEIIPKEVNIEYFSTLSQMLRGGIGGSGCVCGTITAAQIVLSHIFFYSKDKKYSEREIKVLSNKFMEEFKKRRKVTCCRVLTSKAANIKERRENCSKIVEDAVDILEQIMD